MSAKGGPSITSSEVTVYPTELAKLSTLVFLQSTSMENLSQFRFDAPINDQELERYLNETTFCNARPDQPLIEAIDDQWRQYLEPITRELISGVCLQYKVVRPANKYDSQWNLD